MRGSFILKLTGIVLTGMLYSCQTDERSWTLDSNIDLGQVTPIGIAQIHNHLWIADGDNNRLVHIDMDGRVIMEDDGYDRPMHIAADEEGVYVPEYGTDRILYVGPGTKDTLELGHELDAPAGVAVSGNEMAIADFYNHRILYSADRKTWIEIGKEGKQAGEFYYPTDVEITKDKIYVADAYNNRVQVFNKSGEHLSIIGVNEKMNAATGIFVTNTEIMVTDFENDKVHIYNLKGEIAQTLVGLAKPTDLLVVDGKLYVTNYKGKSITIFSK